MKNVVKSVILASTLLAAINTKAAKIGPRKLTNKAFNIAELIEEEAVGMTKQQRNKINNLLIKIKKTVNGQIDTTPRKKKSIYTAECEVDDDPVFNYGQGNAGVIEGTVQEILKECKVRAYAMYGSSSSYGIKQLKIQQAVGDAKATCHVDDDPHFNAHQVVIGKMVGKSTQDIMEDCKDVAQAMYQTSGSSGLIF